MPDRKPGNTSDPSPKKFKKCVLPPSENAPCGQNGNPAALIARLLAALRDDPTTRSAALRLLAQFEAEDIKQASQDGICPTCGRHAEGEDDQ